MFKTHYRIKIEHRENGMLYIPQYTLLWFWRNYCYKNNGIRVVYCTEEEAHTLINNSKDLSSKSKIYKITYINCD